MPDPHQDAVNQAKPWLVAEANRIGELASRARDWASQGRLLLEAARTETHLGVLLNLLRYQGARNREAWEGVLTPLTAALGRCQETAKGNEALAMALARHLLLYAVRAHKYHEPQSPSPTAPGTRS